jgi:hypothetical protein
MTSRVMDRAQGLRDDRRTQPPQEIAMSTSSDRFIRIVLWADAASCAGSGALQLAALQPLVQLLGLPRPLLLESGLFLVIYALAVAFVATRRNVPRALVRLFAIGNAGWCIGCVGLLLSGAVPVTALGVAWVLVQAITVAVLAVLQGAWLSRSARSGSPLAA